MKTQIEIELALKNLKRQHKTNWLAFNTKIEGVLAVLGKRTDCNWTASEDITEHVTADDFVSAGFSQAEAEALVFILTEDCMGQAVNSLEMVERYFCYCLN